MRFRDTTILHLNVLDALRLSFIGSLLLLIVLGYFILKGNQERASLHTLSKNLELKNAQLKTVEHQKLEMQKLLSHETGRLEEHLFQMHLQEEEIRRLLQGKSRAGIFAEKRIAMESLPGPRSAGAFAKTRIGFSDRSERSSRGGSYSQLVLRLSGLKRQIANEQSMLEVVKQVALVRTRVIAEQEQELAESFNRIPSLWPVSGEVTSGFGYRLHPIDGEGEFHSGLDIATSYATPIRATASGNCIYADYKSGFGLTVLLDHENGLVTQYSHCSRLLAHPGLYVEKGETIALVGSTGYSTGPHVHYEIHYHHTPINPIGFLDLTEDELLQQGGIRQFMSNR